MKSVKKQPWGSLSFHRFAPAFFFSFLFLAFATPAEARKIRLGCVDCYSSASFYPIAAQKFAEAGDEIEWIHVQTHPYEPAYERHIRSFPKGTRFETVNTADPADMDRVTEILRGVEFVQGGMDEGTFHSSDFNHRLGIVDNAVETRGLRRNKDEMGASSGYGIPALKLDKNRRKRWQSLNTAMAFAAQFPSEEVVVKLNSGAAGARMDFFPNVPELLRPLLKHRMRYNTAGPYGRVDSLLLQPRIVDREFFINTFSIDGVHYLTGLSEYFRIKWGDKSLYFVDTFLSLNSPEARKYLPMAAMVLDRHGHKDGVAHVEFIGDYLLENNARVAGAGVPWLESAVYGISQLDLQAMRLVNPKLLTEALQKHMFFDPKHPELGLQGTPAKRKQGAAMFIVPTPLDGEVTASGIEKLTSLPSFFSMPEHYKPRAGKVAKTRDQYTAPFILHLFGSRIQMKTDVSETIRLLASSELVQYAPTDCSQSLLEAGQLYDILNSAVDQVRWDSVP